MIFVVGEGAGERGGNFGTTVGLYDKYGPARLRDTPITERGFTGLCTGAAMTGSRPIVDYMFIDFGLDAMGELINQTAKIQYMSDGRLKMPIVLARVHRHRQLGGHAPFRQLLLDLHPLPRFPRRRADDAV